MVNIRAYARGAVDEPKYINSSLPQFQDIDAALKIVDDALAKAGKR